MRKLLVCLSGFVVALNTFALPEYDLFDYASGSPLAGQINPNGRTWGAVATVNTTGLQPVIAPGSLSYSGLPNSTSNSVKLESNGNAGQIARLPLGVATASGGGPLFYSFIMKATTLGTMGTAAANNFIAGFSDTSGSQSATLSRCSGRLVTVKNGTGYQIGIGLGNTTADYKFDSTVRNLNDIVFVVVSWERTASSTNINLWVNPASSTFGSNAPPTATTNLNTFSAVNQDILAGGANAFVLSCLTTTMPTVILDDLRIGRTWAFATGGPEIGTQPANLTRNAGSNAVLSVAAQGTLPLTYRWAKNGANLTDGGNISGATTTNLTVSNLLQVDAGSYTVNVTNSYGYATSSVATLTVTDPAINAQPVSLNLPSGATANFSVVAGGTPTLTYQWIKNDTNYLANGGIISGAQTASLTLTGISASDTASYTVVVTNGLGNSVTSAVATLTVTDPAVTGQPTNQTVNYSTNVAFYVSAAGTGPFSYQWHKTGTGDLTDGGNISGSQSSALSLTAVSYVDAGTYSVTVTNSLGSVDSSNAVLTVRDPLILTNPVSTIASAGTTITLSVLANGSPTLSYQWQRSSTNISDGGNWSGTTSDTLTIMNISSAEAGTYRVMVSGGSGSTVTSSNAVVTVVSPVVITTQPASQTNVSGSSVTFSVSVTGSTPLNYQWLHDNVEIPGANLNTYTILDVQTNAAGSYQVVVTNSVNSVTSSNAVLTVLVLPPTIDSQPSSRTIAPGTRAVFVVSASGSLPFGYQWRSNGVNVTGATAPVYILTNVQSSYNASYTVIVTNPVNSITSAPAVLTVTTNLPLDGANLVVVRVGDGDQILATSGNSVYLDQFTTSGVYVNTITIPETGSSGMIEAGPDLTGTTLTGAALTRSADKKLLVLSGYRVDLGNGTALQNTASATVPRAIALIDKFGQYTLALADTTAYDNDHFRGAAFDGTGNFWGSGSAEGTYYFGTNEAAATIQTTVGNTRSVDIFNGNLYCLGSSATTGLVKFNGLPKIDQGTVTAIIPGASNATDFSVDPGDTLIYLTIGGNVQKWQFDGASVWTNAYSISAGGGTTRYMTVDYSGANPVIYLNTSESPTPLRAIVDTGSNSVPVTIATAGVNQVFKGVRFGPARPTLLITQVGINVILQWSDPSFTLQSATNVTGTYVDVSGATSPYTNSTVSPAQKFFRLRN